MQVVTSSNVFQTNLGTARNGISIGNDQVSRSVHVYTPDHKEVHPILGSPRRDCWDRPGVGIQ